MKLTSFNNDKIVIGVLGLGYVGLPLAVEFSKKYDTIGYDTNIQRINELKNYIDKTLEVSKNDLVVSNNLKYSSNLNKLSRCNVFIVTVPTPVDRLNKPNLGPMELVTKSLASIIKLNDIIIYESTVYPGATEEFCVPILEKISGFKYNKDFFCGYSPERINPGDKKHTLTKIIKVTSGSNNKVADFVDSLYSSIISAGTYKASSIAVAEAAKVIENTQRDVNIALMNELSIIFNKLNLDTAEVLEASGTKWNFLPFRPGLVGGHCIGVDPYYLTHKSIEVGYQPEIILAGRRINDGMSKVIVENTIKEMLKLNINPINSKIGIFGLTFKENCPDLRNTKVLDIFERLKSYSSKIYITDDFANEKDIKKIFGINSIKFEDIDNLDVIILAVGHDKYINCKIKFWENKTSKTALFMDIKSVYKIGSFKNTKIKHWRL